MSDPTHAGRGPIRKILVIGGGTAGWLAAAMLNRALGRSVEITLVESPDIGRIGVGEATIPSLCTTMAFLGFRDEEWMPRVGASYKAAIKFVGWAQNPDGKRPDEYWHPFSGRPEPQAFPFSAPYFPEVGASVSMLHYAHKRRLDGDQRALCEMLSSTPAMCDRKLSPLSLEHPELNVRTAYHIDAFAFGDFLREKAIERGVTRIEDKVIDVRQDEGGFITEVATETGRTLEADFFIDCSGFRSLLLGKTLNEPFISDSDRLLCDRAVAVQCNTDAARDGVNPHTTATALRHGWSWDVPLQTRRGTGYVYCSRTLGDDEAEAELRDHLGEACEGNEARRLKMRVGAYKNLWVKNVVALGLSASFIEPLESTAIFLVEYGIATLITLFPDRDFDGGRIRKYNETLREMYEETRDFVLLHYILTQRTDTEFWNAVREDADYPDSLHAKVELFEHSLPVLDQLRFTLFRAFSYTCIIDGYGRVPRKPHPLLEHVGYGAGQVGFEEIATKTSKRLEVMPSHYDLLSNMAKGDLNG